jgi:hypothetical protein
MNITRNQEVGSLRMTAPDSAKLGPASEAARIQLQQGAGFFIPDTALDHLRTEVGTHWVLRSVDAATSDRASTDTALVRRAT